jgi:hypothetical protein
MKVVFAIVVSALLVGCSNDAPVVYECGGFGVTVADKELRWASKTFRFIETTGVYRTYQDKTNSDNYASFDTALSKLRIYSKTKFVSNLDLGTTSDCVKK